MLTTGLNIEMEQLYWNGRLEPKEDPMIHLTIRIDRYGPISCAAAVDYCGIYFVFVGKPRVEGDFLYIGQTSSAISERIDHHLNRDEEKARCWNHEKTIKGQDIFFASCRVDEDKDREKIEAALIYKLQPKCNDLHRTHYNFDSVSIAVCNNFSEFYIPEIVCVEEGSTRDPCGLICSC